MRKLIAAINITIDGFCDHTAGIPDEEIHYHYADLLSNAGAILYGRITYGLMQYWQELVKNPSGERAMDHFATIMDKVPKIVFSRTLGSLDWESARLATRPFEEEILELKRQPGKDIFLGSPSLILAATNLNLIDEYQLCVHPILAGRGLPLFKDLNTNHLLTLTNTKTFGGGAVLLYYKPKAS